MITEVFLAATALLVAITVFMVVFALSGRLMRELSPDQQQAGAGVREFRRPFFWAVMVRRSNVLVSRRLEADLRQQIVMAGGLEGMTPAEVILLAVVAIAIAVGAGIMTVTLTGWSPWWVALMCAAGALLPFVWLRDQVKKRHLEILRELPFHLDLLTLSVEAGLDFGAAVARMVEKGKPGPLREEFSSFLGEIRMGKTRAEALEAMSQRVGLPALSNFLGSLIQADKLGSGLGRTLRLQSEQLRTQRFQRAEKAAGEAPVKMLIPLLFIFLTTWVILAAPLVFEWIFKGAS
ncbi:type II secretion system F family protein [Myxococcota bacterium]